MLPQGNGRSLQVGGGNVQFSLSAESRGTTLAPNTIEFRMSSEEIASHFWSAAMFSRDRSIAVTDETAGAWSRASFPTAGTSAPEPHNSARHVCTAASLTKCR